MAWNPEKYERWFSTPEGQFALDREVRLLQAVLAGWPRRRRKLLEIGCGTGLFLETLYQMGFDVSGIDKSPEMVMVARNRLANRADLHIGDGELLPFSENEFDYAYLWTVLEFTADPEAMLAEAARVAEKGILIGFLNKNSLYYSMNVRSSDSTLSKASWFTWCEMQDLIRKATGFLPPSRGPCCPVPCRHGDAPDSAAKSTHGCIHLLPEPLLPCGWTL